MNNGYYKSADDYYDYYYDHGTYHHYTDYYYSGCFQISLFLHYWL